MNGYWAVSILASILILGGFGVTQSAYANPISEFFLDDMRCDGLFDHPVSEELGVNPAFPGDFPVAEEITSSLEPGVVICVAGDGDPTNDYNVTITNVSPFDYIDVFFVGDIGVTIGNADGAMCGGMCDAFLIDPFGVNPNLISESFSSDGIFESGETWEFIVTDFVTPGPPLPPTFGSLGVGVSGPIPSSTASILANEDFEFGPVGGTSIPVETTALLVAGAQTTTPWLMFGVVAAVGIGLAVFTIKRSR